MKNFMRYTTVATSLLLAGLAVASDEHGHGDMAMNGQQVMRTAEGVGTVQSVADDGASVTLAHEPIAELRWPAMTMAIALADPVLAGQVKVEDRVRFVLRQVGETAYEIVSLEAVD